MIGTYAPTKPATEKQTTYVRDLVAQRPGWSTVLTGQVAATVQDLLFNAAALEHPDLQEPRFVSTKEASAAISALLGLGRQTEPNGHLKLQLLLENLNVGKYALFRKDDSGVLDFFEIVERKNGKRYLNQLLGCPGDWNRKHLPADLQRAAARAIAGDWVAAAKQYAEHFQACARCDAPLSNPRSRAAKIGHDCAQVWGWPW